MNEFGFTVKRHTEWDFEIDQDVVVPGMWRVFLPHQCSTWDIAGESMEGEPHAEAVAALEKFIANAQEALGKLKAQQEMGDEDR